VFSRLIGQSYQSPGVWQRVWRKWRTQHGHAPGTLSLDIGALASL